MVATRIGVVISSYRCLDLGRSRISWPATCRMVQIVVYSGDRYRYITETRQTVFVVVRVAGRG